MDWALIDTTGKELTRFQTDGINALLASSSVLESLLSKVKAQLGDCPAIDRLYYYGAGCATPGICHKVEEPLQRIIGARNVEATTDLLGAARSLLGRNKGIACILGTGSNSCLYDGDRIADNVPSLGFILGDEGSGASLGKRLVSDAFKGHLPENVKKKFLAEYGLDLHTILDKTYRSPAPNRFLASLVPFLSANLWNPYVYSLVLKEFESFLERNVSRYQGAHTLPIAFTGSLAFHFAPVLREAAANKDFKIGTITASPLDGLIEYHSNPDNI